MLARPVYALTTLLAVTVANAADLVTIPIGSGDRTSTGVGQVVGFSGSLTSYVIEGIPATIVAGASTQYQTWVYPDGDLMSQGCSVVAPSSVECEVYMSDADSGSTTVSSVPASMLSEFGNLIVTITATNTGVRPETTAKTATDSAAPVSTTAETTEAKIATQTSAESTGDGSATSTSAGVVETTSPGAAAHLAMDKSWIGGVFAVMLAAF